jgi:hypothetical protein
MPGCIGLKPDGALCRGIARRGSDYRPAHDPTRAKARHRAASKAARSKPGREIGGLKDQLEELYERVLEEAVSPGVGAVLTQITNARIRLLECERRIREADDLERRIDELREALDRSGGG